MPSLTLFERLPLPTLRKYVMVSFVATGFSILFAWSRSEDFMMEALNSSKNMTQDELDLLFSTLTYTEYKQCFILAITSQLWTVWSLVNMCYCLMAILGKGIQLAVFGPLRVSEAQQLREIFWNFVFYKFIFIFGVLNVQYMNDAFLWTAWYSFLCSLLLFAQLCKYRFEYLSCSPATPKSQHMKLIFLLTLLLLVAFCLVAASFTTALYTDWNVFGFMVAECLLLIVKTVYVILKYTIYLVDINHDGLWETRGSLAYYTDLVCEIAVLVVDLIHYLHMVIWSNIFLSMASLVIWMQVRHLFNEIQKRISRHRNYLKVIRSMEARFAEATEDEMKKYDDNCAICWDKMQKARRLPCGHIFHNPCLRSWLAQDISCPTCRVSLSEPKTQEAIPALNADDDETSRNVAIDGAADQDARRHHRTNRLFHFDASRYISWLPSFSVEVTQHTQSNNAQDQQSQAPELDTMVREVQLVFPDLASNSILDDLRTTHSVEMTVENILEGRLTILSSGGGQESGDDMDSEDSSEEADLSSPIPQDEPFPINESFLPEPSTSTSPDDQHTRQRLTQDRLGAEDSASGGSYTQSNDDDVPMEVLEDQKSK